MSLIPKHFSPWMQPRPLIKWTENTYYIPSGDLWPNFRLIEPPQRQQTGFVHWPLSCSVCFYSPSPNSDPNIPAAQIGPLEHCFILNASDALLFIMKPKPTIPALLALIQDCGSISGYSIQQSWNYFKSLSCLVVGLSPRQTLIASQRQLNTWG